MVKKNRTHVFYRVCLILSMGLCSWQGHAALLFSEDFSGFNSGNLDGQSGWQVSNNDDDAHLVTAGGLSYSSGSVTHDGGANRVEVIGGTEESASYTFGSVSDDDIYFSFLIQDPAIFATVGLTSGSVTDVEANPAGGAARLRFTESRSRMLTSSNIDEFAPSSSEESNVDGLILYVGRISKSSGSSTYDTMSFLVNPDSLAEPAESNWNGPQDFDTGLSSLDTLYFRGPGEQGDFSVDMLRVGTSYDSVVIPEPGTLMLLGIAIGSVLLFRRRAGR